MQAVTVTYTVRLEYVEQNKERIREVMAALRANPIEGMLYSSWTSDDGNTFVHVNIAKDGATIALLNDIPEFQAFRSALKESQPLSPPKRTDLQSVAAGFSLLV